MTSQPIATTTRDNAESLLGAYDTSCHLIYCAVATHGNNDIFGRLSCKHLGVTGILGEGYFITFGE